MTRVGVYYGASGAAPKANAVRELSIWPEYFPDATIELFGTGNIPKELDHLLQYRCSTEGYDNVVEKMWQIYVNTREYIQAEDPHVVVSPFKYHTHSTPTAVASHKENIPYIVKISGDVFNSWKYNIFSPTAIPKLFWHRGVSRIPLKLADHIWTIGPYQRGEAVKYGASASSVTYLPHPPSLGGLNTPTDEEVRTLCEKLHIPRGHKTVLYMGRLSAKKGLPRLEEVINLCWQNDFDVTFVVVGEGEWKSRLATYSNTRTAGRVPPSEIGAYYELADIYFHPSPLEGFPLTIAEANQFDTPVVAFPAGDISFYVKNVVSSVDQAMRYLVHGREPECGFKNQEYLNEDYQQSHFVNTIQSVV